MTLRQRNNLEDAVFVGREGVVVPPGKADDDDTRSSNQPIGDRDSYEAHSNARYDEGRD